MVKIYTRRGDTGTTSLRGGSRIDKNAPRIELLGTLDEAQAALGVARAECRPAAAVVADGAHGEPAPPLVEVASCIEWIERDLWLVMAEVAAEPRQAPNPESRGVDAAMVRRLEDEIDRVGAGVVLENAFAVPGENRLSAAIDLARTIVRRAERVAVLAVPEASLVLAYLNRLSDLCWMLARSIETERKTNHRDTSSLT